MKTKMQSGLFAILLLLAISCTKENDNSPSSANQRSTVSTESSDVLVQSLDDGVQFAVVGKWVLYFDWFCTGSYSSVIVTVKANGTWSSDDGLSGSWVK